MLELLSFFLHKEESGTKERPSLSLLSMAAVDSVKKRPREDSGVDGGLLPKSRFRFLILVLGLIWLHDLSF